MFKEDRCLSVIPTNLIRDDVGEISVGNNYSIQWQRRVYKAVVLATGNNECEYYCNNISFCNAGSKLEMQAKESVKLEESDSGDAADNEDSCVSYYWII